MPRDVLLSVAQLRRRGWTPALVRQFLPAPDELRPNAYGGAPLRLYRAETIRAIESREEVQVAKAAAKRRSAAGEAGAAMRLKRLYERARAMTVTVRRIDEPELQKRAIDAYNAYQQHLGRRWKFLEALPLTADSAPSELASAMFAYARGQLAEFDRQLEEAAKVAGADLVLAIVHDKVRAAIFAAYPSCDTSSLSQRTLIAASKASTAESS
jgi:hypothetical protein